MMPDMPTLKLVPVNKLLIHERHDEQRALPLALRIRSSGVFRNPIIVSPLQDGSGRYMVLDGSNRTTALEELGFPDALVQVVEPDDPGLKLENWNHVVWELNARRFLENIRNLPGILLKPSYREDVVPELEGDCGLVVIKSCKGNTYEACCETNDLESRVNLLNAIVDTYQNRCRLDRTAARDTHILQEIYPHLSGLVIFPQFQIHQVMQLCGEGYMLPSGITRFSVAPRALHVNYPLGELKADKPLEEKNEVLRRWLLDRIAHKGVRYYSEPTVLFDE